MVNKHQKFIDLHIHTTASDGSCSLSEIIELSWETGLSVISITDHDTIEGSKEALNSNLPKSLFFLTGIEISATPPDAFHVSESFHILGYSIDVNHYSLNKSLKKLQDARSNRNPMIISILNDLGFDITMNEVKKMATFGQIGRPHIAKVLTQKKYVNSIQEAFDKYLAKGKKAYVNKFRISCEESIQLITDAGGIPVIAHPYLLGIKNDSTFEALIKYLKSIGLKGIESYYSNHTKERTHFYNHIAEKNNLLKTGGSDFHGSFKSINLGTGKGELFVPYSIYEDLLNTI